MKNPWIMDGGHQHIAIGMFIYFLKNRFGTGLEI